MRNAVLLCAAMAQATILVANVPAMAGYGPVAYPGGVGAKRKLGCKSEAFEALELADTLLGAPFVEGLGKERGLAAAFSRYGMAGQMPRRHAASRFALVVAICRRAPPSG
jgi:hypothetical protein